MKVPELQPILDKIALLKDNPSASDIYEVITREVNAAYTPSMGQTVCVHIIEMCHPRAWGDRFVHGYDQPIDKWLNFLGELEEIANSCGQAIYINSGGKG